MNRFQFQFVIGENWWSLAQVKSGKLIQSWSWKDPNQARSAIRAILGRYSSSTIDLIFDNHDLEFHHEDIPTALSRIDRKSYLQRRLDMTFDKAEYWAGYQLQVKLGRRSSKYPALLVGIERSQQEAWLQIFKELNSTIKSMVFAPIELIKLVKNLAVVSEEKPGNAQLLFLVVWEKIRARICVYEQGYLVLTRLITNIKYTDSIADRISTINVECSNTVGYMRRLNRLQGKQAHLFLVAPEGVISQIPDNLIAPYQQTVFSLAQASTSIGFDVQSLILEDKPHLLTQQALCGSSPELNLLPKDQRLEYQRSILERTFIPATLAALVGFAIFIGWNSTKQEKMKGVIDIIDKDIALIERSITRLKSQQQTDISWPEMKAILNYWDQGEKSQIDIEEWTSKLALVLKRYPALQSRALGVKTQTEGKNETNSHSLIPSAAAAKELTPVLYWEMTVKPSFELNFREIDDTLEDLNNTVSQIAGVLNSEISKRPIDTSPDATLTWQARNRGDGLLSAQINLTLDSPGT